jgi:PAS domain S-box-containing protein/putative nucleotidyltransferase with HDIG domain
MTKILIADDNIQSLYMLETVLKSSGYDVTSAKNGAEALELALNNPPDVMVTDILMPEMDGFELCRRCKADKRLNQIPIVFYTATYTDLKDEQFALSLGADRFVVKPQQPEVLVKIVQEVLASPRRVRQVSPKLSPADEKEVLQRHNEVLFRKLEHKVSQLEDVIAKQKMLENELRESEQKYRTLITQSPDGIFIVNLKGLFLAVNKVMCANLKYSEEELLSMSIWDIVPEEYVELHKKRMADIFMGKAPNTAAEYRVRGKDGNLRYVEILSAPYYEEQELIGFQGIARDITERKQAEELLRSSEEKYRALVENINDVLYTMDTQGNIAYISPVVERFTKYKVSDLIGRPFSPLVFTDDLPGLLASLERLASGQLEPWEFRVLDKDGRIIFVRSSSRPIYEDGQVVGFTALMTDITERKQFEQDLIESHRKTKKTLNDAINMVAKIVEMRDPYTAGHQQKVAQLAIAIAKEMRCEDEQIDQLRMAAIIHDIGKIYVPSDILSKPGKITEEEYALIKSHAQGGYDIVKGMDFPSAVATSILQHHERLDGSGYPNSLEGDKIRLEARILSVSDVVEAMGSHRPYRPALGINKALEEISNNKGRLYDPDVVDACVKLFTGKDFKFT